MKKSTKKGVGPPFLVDELSGTFTTESFQDCKTVE